jgi:hypothetical protein
LVKKIDEPLATGIDLSSMSALAMMRQLTIRLKIACKNSGTHFEDHLTGVKSMPYIENSSL